MAELDIRINPRGAQQGAAAVNRALDDIKRGARGTVDGLHSGFEKVKNGLFSLKGALVGMAAFVGLKRLVGEVVSVNASFERQQVILARLLRSQEAAAAAMERLSDFARRTPYELGQVNEAFVKLTAYGLDADKNLRTLGDTAAAMGKPLMQAVEAMADAVTGEFERLKEFGLKASVEGNKVTFAYSDAAGKMKRTSVANNRAIIEETLRAIWNDKYAGAMEDLSNTWDGLWSNLKDTVSRGMRSIGKETGLFEWLKQQLRDIGKAADESGPKVATFFDEMSKGLSDLKNTEITIKVNWEFFKDAKKVAMFSARDLMDMLKGTEVLNLPGPMAGGQRPTPAEIARRLTASTTELEAGPTGGGGSDTGPDKERDASMKRLLGYRQQLLELEGRGVEALELERDAMVKSATTAEEKSGIISLFDAKIAKERQTQHEQVMENIKEELAAHTSAAAERLGLLERHRQREADANNDRIRDEIEKDERARAAEEERWRRVEDEHEREANAQMAENAEQWRREQESLWSSVGSSIEGAFRSAFDGVKREGGLLLGFFHDLVRSIRDMFIRQLAQQLVGVIRVILGSLGGGNGGGLGGIIGGAGGGGRGSGFLASVGGSLIGRGATSLLGGMLGGGASGGFAGLLAPSTLGLLGGGGGAAAGATAGSFVLPIVGTVIGAAAGSLLGGLFGGGKKKDPVRAQIKQWVSGELWPALDDFKRLGFGMGPFGSTRPGGTDFFKSLGFSQGVPQKWLADMKALAQNLRDVLGRSLSEAFEASTQQSGWRRFLRTLREGISDFVLQGMMSALLKGSALTKALAPFFEQVKDITKDFRKGKIGEGEFGSQVEAAFRAIEPIIVGMQPIVNSLGRVAQSLDRLITGRHGELFIPAAGLQKAHTGGLITSGGAINVQAGERITARGQGGVSVYAPITMRVDSITSRGEAERAGRQAGWGLERYLRRSVVL